jgi:hypothetical protein
LWEDGQKADCIANVFKLPLQKVEEIVQRLKTLLINIALPLSIKKWITARFFLGIFFWAIAVFIPLVGLS